jgi:hypothetical protein
MTYFLLFFGFAGKVADCMEGVGNTGEKHFYG